ncbi:MAG TPA: DegT/DnrJ/EryC1/StrS family aminotransferase [Ferruginibacter sp.]|jgi:dTDP-4-amino-4,6-dideoxygalactose transaminase|nr:DegT/DnrJ/EryC1/StrS family aminotransferase [Ferruginibacter sp.]
MKVPFVDLYAQYLTIKKDIDQAIENVIKNSSYIGGEAINNFEKSFADYLGLSNVLACANGTDSIEILLQSFGIGKDDEVIVPAASWISTSEAITTVGATPVFVDIEEDYFTIDVSLIEKAITPKTKAIIPVHLYGHPADMPAIMAIAKKNNLIVIEDCAQAHGAAINGKKVGTFGDASSFSFYPGKNLGAYGDAGCMATNDTSIATKARMIANHGQQGKHNHIIEGRNSRLDGLQAAILSVKLPYLEQWTEARIKNAASYSTHLASKNIILPKTKPGYRNVFHLYVIKTQGRDELKNSLQQNDIETAIHYPTALPFLPCYQNRNFKPQDFPVAFACQSTILSLPMFAELTIDQIKKVAGVIK